MEGRFWPRLWSWLGWTAVVATIVMNGAASGFGKLAQQHLPLSLRASSGWFQLTPLFSTVFVVVGALIVWRRPGNRIGWVAIGIGFLAGFEELVLGYWTLHFVPNLPGLPLLGVAGWLVSWVWLPPVSLMLFYLPYLFPNGKPLSPRWRALGWIAGLAVAIGIVGISLNLQLLSRLSQLVELVCAVLGPVTLGLRYKRAGFDERQQIKWFAVAALVVVVVAISGTLVSFTLYHTNTVVFNSPFDVLIPLSLTGLAVSIGVSVLRYHLYDIDVFIRRALVYAALVVLISLLYLVAVVTVGERIDLPRSVDRAVPFVIAAIIALLFQPVRVQLQRLANRLVYGRRATPYEVLARLSRSMAELGTGEDVPLRMAHVLAEGTEANRAEVWLRVGGELRRAAVWPPAQIGIDRLPLDGTLPAIPEATASAQVRYQDEDLGVLAVVKREPMTPVESRLVDDLAHEAGLALKNVRLNAELMQRLEELTASRQRLVKAQDEERRRIERNLHDGAQQNLVGLKLKLAAAKTVAKNDPQRLSGVLDELIGETGEAIEVLRELARGIYPPLLADSGLAAALQAHARRSSIPVAVEGDGIGRYPAEIEAALYFCCLEALQNAIKHSQAKRVVISLQESTDRLCFSVVDDGQGMDPAVARRGSGMQNMADRLAALGGHLDVRSSIGRGTEVSGWLPLSGGRRDGPS